MKPLPSWLQYFLSLYSGQNTIDIGKYQYVFRSITAILVASFSLYIGSSLPYYPRGWLVLIVFLTGIIWFANPNWGRLIAIITYILPVASMLKLGIEGIFGVAILFLILATILTPFAFIVFAALTLFALHANMYPLILIIPLIFGFLKSTKGVFLSGLAALYAEIIMFIRPVASIGFITGGVAGKPILFPLRYPAQNLLDFSWLQNQMFSDSMWQSLVNRIFPPFAENPVLIGEILLWVAIAAVVSIVLYNSFSSSIPRFVQSVAIGSVFAIVGQVVVAIALGKGNIDFKALIISAIVSGIAVFIISPLLIDLPAFLEQSLPDFSPNSTSSGSSANLYQSLAPNQYQPSVTSSTQFPSMNSNLAHQSATLTSPSIAGRTLQEKAIPSAIPTEVWGDLIGIQAFQRNLQDSIESQFNPVVRQMLTNLSIEPTRGILLFGPQGTGKSTLAKIIAHEANAALYSVQGDEFYGKDHADYEKSLKNVFLAAKKNRPAIICFDDIETFLSTDYLASFLGHFDSLSGIENILVIGTTSSPWKIDRSVLEPTRFDKLIHVGLPDESAREQIFQKCLISKSLEQDVSLSQLAKDTHSYSGGEIVQLCADAYNYAVEKHGSLSQTTIQMADFLFVMSTKIPKTTEENVLRYESFLGENGLPKNDNAQTQVSSDSGSFSWDDVAGYQKEKDILSDVIVAPLAHPEIFKQYGAHIHKALLVFGPSGCGKQYMVKVAASIARANVLYLDCRILQRESEIQMRNYFKQLRQKTPSVMFLDHFEIMAPAPVATELPAKSAMFILSELESLEQVDGILIIASSSVPGKINPTFFQKGYFDLSVSIPLPDKASRIDLLNHELSSRPTSVDLDLENMADALEGYTCAEIAAVCNAAATKSALNALKQSGKVEITSELLLSIIRQTTPSVSQAEIEQLANFEIKQVR